MLSDHRFVARAFAILGVVLGLCGSAGAVAAFGPAKRVDVDPTAAAAPIYRFGLSFLTRTPTGGFAIAWEEDSRAQTPNAYERIRFRIFGNTFAPVAAPQAANLSGGKRLPGLSGIVPLGTNKAFLFYGVTRDNSHPDHPFIREAFGQVIALATGGRPVRVSC